MSVQDDFVPKQYMKWCKDTQDNVPSEFLNSQDVRDYVKLKLSEDLNLKFDDVFSYWDDKPLGVASIGQCHRAILKSTGEVVAVKILCPGIERRFRSDIKTIKSFCSLAMPQHVSALEEIERAFLTEFDYVREATYLNAVRNNIMPKYGSMVTIPKAHMNLCSKDILVMEFLDGIKMVDGIKKNYSKLCALQGRTLEDMEKEMKEKILKGEWKFKSIEDDKRDKQRMKLYLALKNWIFSYNIPRFIHNISITRLIFGPIEYQLTEAPIDVANLIEILSAVHLSEILDDGLFNGDGHPGNVLLLSNGKLGLIDYGQTKELELKERVIIAKLIIAMARDDKKEIVRLFLDEMGGRTKYTNKDIIYRLNVFYFDRNSEDICQGMNIATFLDYCESKDPMVQAPLKFVMAARVGIMLRGLGNAFGIKLSMAKMWQKQCEKFLKNNGIEY